VRNTAATHRPADAVVSLAEEVHTSGRNLGAAAVTEGSGQGG